MKILIVGGGIGGLALASFLEKENIQYTLIDREKDWSKHGYSLGMWSNGRAMLAKLGLKDKFDASIIPYRKLDIKTFTGKILKSYDLNRFYVDYGLGYSHIHRQDLHEWLLSGVDNSKIKMSLAVQNLTSVPQGVKVTFSDDSQGIFDLVVGADGVHSSVRKIYFAEDVEHYINWRMWYAIPRSHIGQPHTVTEYLEPSRFINIFDDGEKNLAVFGSTADHTQYDQPSGRVARLKQMFQDSPLAEQLLKDLSDVEILPADLEEVKLNKWSKDQVVLIGDAAHTFEPFAGLGGSMALEDAYILAGELMKISPQYKLHDALKSYEQKRKKRVAEARHVTWKMKTWATVTSPLFYKIMNWLAPFIPARYFARDFIELMSNDI